jgi:uncharacterized phage protein (TIGR02220 family)
MSKKKKETVNEAVEEIIEYLNFKLQTRYNPKTSSTIKKITGRLSEGYSVSDFKEVIDHQRSEWIETTMKKYLRPETLFRASNFESYLNDARMPKPEPKRMSNRFNKKIDTQSIVNNNNGLFLE